MPAILSRPRIRRSAAPTDRAIRTEKEYDAAVAEIDSLLDSGPKKGTADFNRLELLSILVEAYEDEHDEPIAAATPQEMVEFVAEQKGISRTELATMLGGRSRLSDFLNNHRALSINQVTKLRERLGIPADLLISA
ncbi:MAG: helix-turn-helix domain-containing protein [Gemmatimonadaceae bacterium]|nr:helix-turn-helix domain-containing protein [Gemmatimonadaceae bacterium]